MVNAPTIAKASGSCRFSMNYLLNRAFILFKLLFPFTVLYNTNKYTMKRIMAITGFLLLLSTVSSGQFNNRRSRSGSVTLHERFELRRDLARYHVARQRAVHDGRVTPLERRKLSLLKNRTKRDLIRFRHNRSRRII
jgi:hypothetical protein